MPTKQYYQRIFLTKLKKDLRARQTKINHTLFIGNSGSGKTYNAFKQFEYLIKMKQWNSLNYRQYGNGKIYYLWVEDREHLEEIMTFLIPSKEPMEKFEGSPLKPFDKPPQFQMRIYIPISQEMPKYATNGIIVPFSVSIDNIEKATMQVLLGTMDVDAQYTEYMANKYDGMSFTEFKLNMLKSLGKRKRIHKRKGFMDDYFIKVYKRNYVTQQNLANRLDVFDDEGIFGNTKFRLSLERLLPREVKDQETICVLYVGNIKNRIIRRFVYMYFMETLVQTLHNSESNLHPYKHVFYHSDLDTLVMPTSSPARTGSDMAINTYLSNISSVGRHNNIEIWADVKSPNDIDERTRRRFSNWYVTRIDDYSDIRLLGEAEFGTRDFKRYCKSLITSKRTYHGFVIKGMEIPEWYTKNFYIKYGFRLPYPRICQDGKVRLDDDFAYLNGIPLYEIIGGVKEDVIDVTLIKQALLKLIKKGEDKLIEFMEKEHEESTPTKLTKEDRFNEFLENVKALKIKNPEKNYFDYKKYELESIFKLNKTTIWNYENMAREKGIDLNKILELATP
ncbi:MAG: hypothetical protein AABY22_11640 [Nanoarchaeota archaeon]